MTPNKAEFFENATQTLVRKINAMGMDKLSRMRAKNFVLLFRDSFKLPAVKHATFNDLSDDDIRKFTYDADGFCRASSAAFAALMGAHDWKLMFIGNGWSFGPHHYLVHVPSNTILDLTFDQYSHVGIKIPYFIGREIKLEINNDDTSVNFCRAIGIDLIQTIKKQKDS